MMGTGDQLGQTGFAMTVGILFFVLCCFIENYAEFSQAVFVPFILFVVAGSRAQTLIRAAATDQPENSLSFSGLRRATYGPAARPIH
jgi:hypothetical protein